MSLGFSQQAVVTTGGAVHSFASLLADGIGNRPEYVVLTGLDRERYTVTSNGNRGTITGNGKSQGFAAEASDCYNFAIVFTATDKGYYNSTYGYLNDLTFKASTDTLRSESLSLYGFGAAGTADPALLATLTATVASPSFAGLGFTYASLGSNSPLTWSTANYLGTLTFVTQPGYADATPNQATPGEIAGIAASFIGQAWNQDGCWNLACIISTLAGASLPLTSTKATPTDSPPVGNGQWFVAYNSATVDLEQQKNWITQLQAGDVVVVNNTCGGHVATVVAGSGYAARLLDNYGFSANDGSDTDILIKSSHDLLNLIIPADEKNVVIYRLDAPKVGINKQLALATGASAAVAPLVTASDPDGKTITHYQLYDTGSGAFQLNGVSQNAHSAATALTVSATDFTDLRFGAGPQSGTDTLMVRAFNGTYWGDWNSLDVAVGSTVQPPALQALSGQVVLHGGKSVSLASLLTIDNGGAAIRSFTVTDSAGGSGYVSLNGATPTSLASSAAGNTYEVTAADFARLTYESGNHVGGSTLTIVAHNDSPVASNAVSLSMGTIAPNVSGITHYVAPATAIPLSSLLSVAQFDTTPLVSFTINTQVTVISWGANSPSSGGTLQLNGATLLSSLVPGTYEIAAGDLDKVTFRAASDTGGQFLQFWASDGANGISGTALVQTTTATTPVTAKPATVLSGSAIAATGLFSVATDAHPVFYRLLDPGGGGSLRLDPSATNLQAKSDPTPGVYVLAADDLAKLTYVGAAANGTETLAISTSSDNFHWSAEVALPVTTTGVVTGAAGNESFAVLPKGSVINGGGGIDTVSVAGSGAGVVLSRNGDGSYSLQRNGGTDVLRNVERLHFADRKIALDLSDTGSAGKTVELMGAALGVGSWQTHKDYAGIALALFDDGWSMARVAQLCLDKGLLPNADNAGFVRTVWQNVMGTPGDAGTLAHYTALLQGSGGLMTKAELLAYAAISQANYHHTGLDDIGLTGLPTTGLDYL